MVAILNDQHENLTYIQSSVLLTAATRICSSSSAGIELYDENHQVLRLLLVVGAKKNPSASPSISNPTFCVRNGLSNRDSGATMEHAHCIVPGVFLQTAVYLFTAGPVAICRGLSDGLWQVLIVL